jgi:glucose-1-phosphate cytidylyltransferase
MWPGSGTLPSWLFASAREGETLMKVIILCGGQGTRLREHTETRPKPSVEVGGKPLLWHLMKIYAHHGIHDFILSLGYKGHVIKDYFLNYECMNADFTIRLGRQETIEFHGRPTEEDGWRVTLADSGERAMTGARIKRVARYLGEPPQTFCVTYGDGLADVDIRALIAYHRQHGRLATVTGVVTPSRFGVLHREADRVLAFREKPEDGESLVNGGFFVFEPGFLDYLSAQEGCVLEREPLERCAADDQLRAYEHRGHWQCMDTLRDWETLELAWQRGNAPWKVWA